MDEYYLQQAGSGLGSFSGVRYQRGDGFFGRLISGTILPLVKKVLPFLGKTALDAGVGAMNDWSKGEKLSESLKNHFAQGTGKVTDALEAKVKKFTGSGNRKRGKSVDRTNKKLRRNVKKKPASRKKKQAIDFL